MWYENNSLVLVLSLSSQRVPSSIVLWGLASFIILSCTSVVITTLIVARIWYLSPRKRHNALGMNFPTDTADSDLFVAASW